MTGVQTCALPISLYGGGDSGDDLFLESTFSATKGNIYLRADTNLDGDSRKLYFGAGNDASITYDNTNWLFTPDSVGTGYMQISTAQPLALVIGKGTAGVDYQIKFDGETNDGILTYDEDNDQLAFDGAFKANDFYSGDGSQGITQTETGVNNFDIVIKDGLITSFTKNS